MSARERQLRARHAQLVAQLEHERAALAASLRGLTADSPRLAREELQDQLKDHWPALAARVGQWAGALLLARRGALPAGWLGLALEVLRWHRSRRMAGVGPGGRQGKHHSGRVLLVTAAVGAIAAALWRQQRAPAPSAAAAAANCHAPDAGTVEMRKASPTALH